MGCARVPEKILISIDLTKSSNFFEWIGGDVRRSKMLQFNGANMRIAAQESPVPEIAGLKVC